MPNYQDNAPAGWMGDPRRGAAMGRPSIKPEVPPIGKFTLQQIRLDSGGYDICGAYWGHHQRLYWCTSECGTYDSTLRAVDRNDAKRQFRETYPNARFYR
jgi:hypothetical protein